jgi:hypothetical protein
MFLSETPQSGASCLRKLSRRPGGHGSSAQCVERSGARPRASANSSLGNLIACFRKQLAEQSYPQLQLISFVLKLLIETMNNEL